jgi:hypothetical protein
MLELINLPSDLLIHIISYLPLVDLCRFRRCARRFDSLIESNCDRLAQIAIEFVVDADASRIEWRKCLQSDVHLPFCSGLLKAERNRLMTTKNINESLSIDGIKRRQMFVRNLHFTSNNFDQINTFRSVERTLFNYVDSIIHRHQRAFTSRIAELNMYYWRIDARTDLFNFVYQFQKLKKLVIEFCNGAAGQPTNRSLLQLQLRPSLNDLRILCSCGHKNNDDIDRSSIDEFIDQTIIKHMNQFVYLQLYLSCGHRKIRNVSVLCRFLLKWQHLSVASANEANHYDIILSTTDPPTLFESECNRIGIRYTIVDMVWNSFAKKYQFVNNEQHQIVVEYLSGNEIRLLSKHPNFI